MMLSESCPVVCVCGRTAGHLTDTMEAHNCSVRIAPGSRAARSCLPNLLGHEPSTQVF